MASERAMIARLLMPEPMCKPVAEPISTMFRQKRKQLHKEVERKRKQ